MNEIEQAESIPTGALCQLEVNRARYRSTIRGLNADKYIIMDTPQGTRGPLVIPSDSVFVVRFISRGVVYGFETALMKAYTKPVALWVTSYPDNIESVSLRKSQRINTLLIGDLEAPGGAYHGALVDLSRGGGLFSTSPTDAGQLPENGAKGYINLGLPSGEKIEKLAVDIRSCHEKEGKVLLGLSFSREARTPYKAITAFYEECVISQV